MPATTPIATPAAVPSDAQWGAIVKRQALTSFLYAVVTTGVYCRPNCPSRRARRENVRIFESAAEAGSAGFRPCKRCRPNEEVNALALRAVTRMCRALEQAEQTPTLEQLARGAGLSSSHARRVFQRATGLTPKAYHDALLRARASAALSDSRSVTEAIYAAGFTAPSRFYERADAMLGMAPATFRSGAPGVVIRFALASSSLGEVLVAATERGICSVLLGDERAALVAELQHRFARAELTCAEPEFEAVVNAVLDVIEGQGLPEALPLDVQGTVFQAQVWRALQSIPRGRVLSYSELALQLGRPSASRAVARACASNPVAVLIPCHRVVRAGGALAGYRWGIARKRELLLREGALDE